MVPNAKSNGAFPYLSDANDPRGMPKKPQAELAAVTIAAAAVETIPTRPADLIVHPVSEEGGEIEQPEKCEKECKHHGAECVQPTGTYQDSRKGCSRHSSRHCSAVSRLAQAWATSRGGDVTPGNVAQPPFSM